MRSFLAAFCFLIMCAMSFQSTAQVGTWAANSGSSTFNTAYKTTVTNNALYMCGVVNGNIFFAKFSLSGTPVWSKTINTTSSQTSDIAVRNGYVYITGFFSGSNINFDPSGNYPLSSNGGFDVFLAKYSEADGSFIHAKSFGGGNTDFAKAIEVDANDNIYLTGYFASTVNFSLNGGNNSVVNPSALNADMFIVKYSQPAANNFSLQWITAVQGTDVETIRGYALAIDEANNALFVTGTFSGTNVSFNPAAGDHQLNSPGSYDVFITKYSMNSGLCSEAGAISSPFADNGNDISFYNGDLFVTGNLSTNVSGSYTTNFDVKGGNANRSFTGGNGDIFIAKYNANDLSLGFAYVLGSSNVSGSEAGNGIKAMSTGVYVTGSFQGTVDFDPTVQTSNLISAGNTDIFFAKYSLTGGYLGARKIGGGLADMGYSIDANASDDLFVAGNFGGSNIDFDPGPGTIPLTAVQTDYFVAGYNYATVLPIRFSNFTGALEGNTVQLQWRTLFELNNKGFLIERSNNSAWTPVGFAGSKGNSNAVHDYTFKDVLTNEGTYLYRLRQEDTDGSISYSSILKFDFHPTTHRVDLRVDADQTISVVIHFNRNENVSVGLFDAQGRSVHQQKKLCTAGTNVIKMRADQKLEGIYFVQVRGRDLHFRQSVFLK